MVNNFIDDISFEKTEEVTQKKFKPKKEIRRRSQQTHCRLQPAIFCKTGFARM
jgi:hypothetical protein